MPMTAPPKDGHGGYLPALCLDPTYKFGRIARVSMNRINGSVKLFQTLGEPVKIIHGEAEIHGFRLASAAYLTDFSDIPPSSLARLQKLDILFF